MQNSQHTIKSLLDFAKQVLAPLYPAQEVQAFCRILFSEFTGVAPAQLYISLEKNVEENVAKQIQEAVVQLQKMRPIQHILGKTEFYGMTFAVNEHTLIPRPETEELVDWIVSELRITNYELRILDIGTGSGCIAISLAKNIPQSEVHAWDISEKAIEVAKKNAVRNGVNITFEQHDILNLHSSLRTKRSNLNPDVEIATSLVSLAPRNDVGFHPQFNVIVSNPPYVCQSEKSQMSNNVLRYEPHSALFVEDSTPLLFYIAIADFAKKTLHKNGLLYFEINAQFGNETVEMLKENGFSNVTLRKDINGKDRMVRASFNG